MLVSSKPPNTLTNSVMTILLPSISSAIGDIAIVTIPLKIKSSATTYYDLCSLD